jgi:hypothetical protein
MQALRRQVLVDAVMMKVIFYNSATMLAYEIPRAMMLEVFDFARVNDPAEPDNMEDTVDLYGRMLESSQPIEGDLSAIQTAYITFLRGIHESPADHTGEMRQHIADDVGLMYGFTNSRVGSDGSFSFWTTDTLSDFDEQLKLHRQISSPMGRA